MIYWAKRTIGFKNLSFGSLLILFAILGLFKRHFKEKLECENLRPLLDELPGYIVHCREDNTVKTYKNAFNTWSKWCTKFCVTEMPAQPLTIALFILNLIQLDSSFPKIESVFYAIKFYHKLLGYNDPCNTLTKNMLEAAKRICQHQVSKKKPISVQHLILLYEKLIKNNVNLSKMRIMNICLLGFCGFLRYQEISNLKRQDIVFCDTYMKLFIEKSKTDTYREGKWVFISKCDSEICPVENLKLYLQKGGITDCDCESYLFRAINVTKLNKFGCLRKQNSPLSYTRTREILLEALESIGLEKKSFGLHSLRSGGATAAANSGVPDRLFKRHGRWKSDKAKGGYVEDDTHHLLLVSKNLG